MTFTTPSITFPIIGFVIGILLFLLSILNRMLEEKYKLRMFFAFLIITLNTFSLTGNLKSVTTISAENVPVQEPKMKSFRILIEKTRK